MTKYITITTYVDLETGECITKTDACKNYYIVRKTYNTQVKIINKPGQNTLKWITKRYIIECRPANQIDIWKH